MAAATGVSFHSAVAILLCAVAGLMGSVEARGRCVRRGQVCRLRRCCARGDECRRVRRFGRLNFYCRPKRPRVLKADGAECSDDKECVNACLSVPCDEYSSDDSGDCGGVCGELPTVDYEPYKEPVPECNGLFEDCSNGGGCCDGNNNAKAKCLPTFGEACEGQEQPCGFSCRPTTECVSIEGTPCNDDDTCCGDCEADSQCEREGGPYAKCPRSCVPKPIVAGFARGVPCPGPIKKHKEICHRNHWYRRCEGKTRCAWGKRKINGYRRWVGVCKNPPKKPIFNC